MLKTKKTTRKSRIISALTALAIFISIFTALNVSAEIFSGDGWSFDSDTGTLTVTSNDGTYIWRTQRESRFEFSHVTTVIIESTVTEIGRNAFNSIGATTINIPDSVVSIGIDAFKSAHIITIDIPDSVTSIDYGAFTSASLTSINVGTGNSNYSSVDGVLFNKDRTKLIQYPAGKTTAVDYAVPLGVTEIGNSAFLWQEHLTSIVIAQSVEFMGDGVFLWCNNLREVTFNSQTPPTLTPGTFANTPAAMKVFVPYGTRAAYAAAFKTLVGVDLTPSYKVPLGYNENDFTKLIDFAMQDDNLDKLDWDLDDPDSWRGISWDTASTKRVRIIDIYSRTLTGSLDVSDFTSLQQLIVSDNQLTALDVSNNTALRQLFAESNRLTTLDVSKNTSLTHLRVSGNQLKAFDVSNNKALMSLEANDNQLRNLNVSNNIALLSLYVRNNQLTALDVSSNTSLGQLHANGNQLKTLNFSNNTELSLLNASNNQLTDISSFEDFQNLITVNVSYNLLNLQNAKVQASIEKIQGTVDGNSGTFEYTPQKCLTCKRHPCICDGNHDDVQSGGNSARDAIINGFGIGGEAGSINNSGKSEINGYFENDTYIKHSGIPLVYIADKNFADFIEVRRNGRRLTRGTHYTAQSGSTIITLLPEYLDALEVGEHELSVHFSGLAVVRASFTVANAEYDDVSTLAGILGDFDSIDN
ncbi:MAG: leucine-rich repeat protein [Oscillospiraceae bacterium]|nr:leucine-rich repeat protein [Oscillospiraceae bacterium]